MPATVALGQRQASSSAYERAYRLVLKFEKATPKEVISTEARLILLGMIADEIASGDEQVAAARAVTRGALVSLQATMDRVSDGMEDFLRPVAADSVGTFDHISVPVAGVMRALGDRPTDRALNDLADAMRRGPVEPADGRPEIGDEELRKTTTAVELLDDRIALGSRAETERAVPRQAAE